VVLFCVVAPVAITFSAYRVFGPSQLMVQEFHAALELASACIAVVVATLLMLRMRYLEASPHYAWMAMAMLSLGVVDAVDSVVPFALANSWLPHLTFFLGGFLFSLVWAPSPPIATAKRGWFVMLTVSLTAAVATAVWWYHPFLPNPWSPRGIVAAATAVNLAGTAGFFAAAVFFVQLFRKQGDSVGLGFLAQALLFGSAATLLAFSHLWAVDWWASHVVRLLGFIVALAVVYEDVTGIYRDSTQLAALVSASDAAVIGATPAGIITSWNEGAHHLYGYTTMQATGRHLSVLARPEDHQQCADLFARVRAGQSIAKCDVFHLNKRGDPTEVAITLSPIKNRLGETIALCLVSRDISERRHAEAKLRRLNRVLETISECNEALIRITEEQELLNSICNIVVNRGGYRMAWVGYAEHDQKKTVRPIAETGQDAGYLQWAAITWEDTERGRGPTGTAIRTGKTAVCQDAFIDANLRPWRENAVKNNYRSVIALPLRNESETFGALVIYAGEPSAFDSEEQHFLEQLANDLGYGVMALRTRQERNRAEEALRRNESILKQAGSMARLGAWEIAVSQQGKEALRRAEKVLAQAGQMVLSGKGDLSQLEADAPLHFSEEACRIWGYAPGEKLTLPMLLQRVHPDDRQHVVLSLAQSVIYQKPYEAEHRLVLPDGSERVVRAQGEISFDRKGRPARMAGAVQDVTEERNTRKKIRLQASEHETLLATTSDGYWRCDSRGRLLDVNEAYCRMHGYSRQELLNLNVSALEAAPEGSDGIPKCTALVRNKGFAVFETRGRRKDGTLFACEISASYWQAADQFLGFVRDITERKRAEEAVRYSEEQIRLLMDSTAEGIYGIDLHGNCTFANRACAQLSRHDSPDALLGRNMHEVLHHTRPDGSPYPVEECRIFLSFRKGQPSHVDDEVIWRKDGTSFPAEYWSYPLYRAGELVGSVVTFMDISIRQRAQEEQRKSERKFRMLSDSNVIGIMAGDTTGALQECNRAFLEMLGYTQEDLDSGILRWDLTHPPEIVSELNPRIARALQEKGVFGPIEMEQLRKDGTRVPVMLGLAALDEGANRAVGFLVDLSERKKMEDALRRTQQVLEQAGHMAQLGAWELEFLRPAEEIRALAQAIVDHPDTLPGLDELSSRYRTNWADETYRICGYEAASMTITPGFFLTLVHPEDRKRIFIALARSLATLEPVAEEHRLTRRDGSVRTISMHGQIGFDRKGQPNRLFGAMLDITERKRAEEALRKSQQELAVRHRIANVFLTLPDEQIYSDVLTIILQATQSTEGKFGYIDEEGAIVFPSMTTNWEQCTMSDKSVRYARDAWCGCWGRALEQKRSFVLNEPGRVPAGHTRIHRVMAVPVLSHGELLGEVVVANKSSDYTEEDLQQLEQAVAHIAPVLEARLERDRQEKKRKAAEEELGIRAQQLARSNEELQQFAYVASHDLQEPLRMVSGYTQLLARRYQGKFDKEADEFIAFALDGTKRMQDLINGLLDYSRVTTRGKEPLPVNCEKLLETVLTDLKVFIEEQHACITHGPLPNVMADEVQLRRVLQNLINNAVKFHGARTPEVHVSSERDETFWRISVRDNGIGIDTKDIPRLFQIFTRLHTREEYPGTGMGLAITKRIVERHGGRIWVASEPDNGSTFAFTLPAVTP
jgi:PAS domain S-box-containing protein